MTRNVLSKPKNKASYKFIFSFIGVNARAEETPIDIFLSISPEEF